ncbi:Transcriptional regulator, GntR family [Burkholderia sp. 8Y]|uniref:GntR family transcriptional regulator n=1 Tax=Burkholderia sp. 8Y TaxID=2653133 RepID=UPI0012F1B6CE|nr:GntR family transcriptional regulator [Burkholderia sp. 8Y]VXC79871.1 Transcriptional regulator, GntR family [Burkholderia sp. 8Y]
MGKKSQASGSTSRERFDRIYYALRERICLLEYEPGALLSEDDLAQQFGVSRTPLRRVLIRLESEGLVESQHGVGTFVTDVDTKTLADAYQFRLELASLIGRLSPLPRSLDDLSRMRQLAARGKRLAASPTMSEFARLNMDYCLELTAMIGNAPLKETVQRLFFLVIRVWIKTLEGDRLKREAEVFRHEIEAILSALEIGDLESAGYLHRTHLSMSFARLRDYAASKEMNTADDSADGAAAELQEPAIRA